MAIETGEPKKKRGRPPKVEKESTVINEEKEIITMAEKVTTEDVANRWKRFMREHQNINYSVFNKAFINSSQNIASKEATTQNLRVKNINTQPTPYTKQEVENAIKFPQNNEIILRGASSYLNFTNYLYYTILRLERDIPNYHTYATPQYVKKEEMSKPKFKDESQFVDKILKKFNPTMRLKNIAHQVAQEGKASYLTRISYDGNKKVNYFIPQKLDSRYVKITGVGGTQPYIVSFDFSLFFNPAYDIEFYGEEFKKIWDDLIENGIVTTNPDGTKKLNIKATPLRGHKLEVRDKGAAYSYWVPISQNLVYTFGTDMSNPYYFPDTVGLIDDGLALEDYKWLMGQQLSKNLTSVLTGEVPMIKDPKAGADQTSISVDLVQWYTDLFNSTVSSNIFAFFAPFTDYELHSLEADPQSSELVYNRVRDFLTSTGYSALLTVTDKPSVSQTNAAKAILAAKTKFLTSQFENYLNNVINSNFELNYDWNIKVWGDIFTDSDELGFVKEMVIAGHQEYLPRLLSGIDMSIEDCKSTLDYIDSMGLSIVKLDTQIEQLKSIKEATKLASQPVESDSEETNSVGRPAMDEKDIDNDSTAKSKELGEDTADTRE